MSIMTWFELIKSLTDFSNFIETKFMYANAAFDKHDNRYHEYIAYHPNQRKSETQKKVKQAKEKVLHYLDNIDEEWQEQIAYEINHGQGWDESSNNIVTFYAILVGLMAKALGANPKEVVEGFEFGLIYHADVEAAVREANITPIGA